jgi:thiamine-monophosphate kinase
VTEFDLISRFLTEAGAPRDDVVLGVGDDCALLTVPAGQQLAVSIDTLVSGVHFLPDADPESLGYKSLAAGLSDLAAMGAEPAWATLALTLPPELAAGDAPWVRGFVRGLSALACDHGVALVGGDTTGGPLGISIQVHGFVPPDLALRRSGARSGDLICVSGTLGDAGLALRALLAGGEPDGFSRGRLERPTPRVALGLALRGLATAAIDCSDGLAADLGHLTTASGLGAEVILDALPLARAVGQVVGETEDWSLPLSSGDDYELCFCLPPTRLDQLAALRERAGCQITVVGRLQDLPGCRFRDRNGGVYQPERDGYEHFAGEAG